MKNKTNYPQGAAAPKSSTNRKNKVNLLLGLGLGVAVMVGGLSSCGHFNFKSEDNDSDTQAYKACSSVADYRAYMSSYGTNGKYYKDAKNVVDRYVADSTTKAQKAHAKEQAEERAEAKAEAERKEDESYRKCTTISACNAYLNAYPNGRYVNEVKAKKNELEKKVKDAEQSEKNEDEFYKKCTTVAACDAYLKAYPNGRYVAAVNKKKAELQKNESTKPGQNKVNVNKPNNNNNNSNKKKVKVKK